MPYMIRKQKCNQTDGDSGTYVLSYTDKSGKKHRNCHTSKKKAKSQIAAIEIGESIEMEHSLKEILYEWVRNVMQELLESNNNSITKEKKLHT